MSLFNRKDVQFLKLCVAGSNIFSTCSKRKYMSILVDEEYHVIGMGYNGGPKGMQHCSDGGCERALDDSPSGSLYDNCIAIHAEQNAFLHSDHSSKPTRLYVNGPPCFTCAKMIVNSSIEKVFYIRDDSYKDWPKVWGFLTSNGVEVLAFSHAGSKD